MQMVRRWRRAPARARGLELSRRCRSSRTPLGPLGGEDERAPQRTSKLYPLSAALPRGRRSENAPSPGIVGFRRRGRGSNRRRGGPGKGRAAQLGRRAALQRSHGRGGSRPSASRTRGIRRRGGRDRARATRSSRSAAAAILRGGRRGASSRRGTGVHASTRAMKGMLEGWASRGKSTRRGVLAEAFSAAAMAARATSSAIEGPRAVRAPGRVRARRRQGRGGRRHGSASEGAQRNDRRRVEGRAAADASEGVAPRHHARRWSRSSARRRRAPTASSRGRRRRVVLRGASNLGGRCVGRRLNDVSARAGVADSAERPEVCQHRPIKPRAPIAKRNTSIVLAKRRRKRNIDEKRSC